MAINRGQVDSSTGRAVDTGEKILEELKKVDGNGSGLDADTVDGKQAAEFAEVANNLSDLDSAATARTNLSVDSSTEVDSKITIAVSNHEAASDPHSQYATDTDLSNHTGDTNNPHGVTAAQVGSYTKAETDDAIQAHEAEADPHPQYVMDSEIGTAAGYDVGTGAGHIPTNADVDARIPAPQPGPNLIINGDFRINQRGAATKAQAVGVYGYDRWRGASGGTLLQVIEKEDVRAGTYTLSWQGGGNGAVGFIDTPAPSPVTVEHNGNGHVYILVPDTATDVKFEPGSVATPFQPRSMAEELALCQRYYERITVWLAGEAVKYFYPFPTVKRDNPNVEFLGSTPPGASLGESSPHGVVLSLPAELGSFDIGVDAEL